MLDTHLKQENSSRILFLLKNVWNIAMFQTFAANYLAVGSLYVNGVVESNSAVNICQSLQVYD